MDYPAKKKNVVLNIGGRTKNNLRLSVHLAQLFPLMYTLYIQYFLLNLYYYSFKSACRKFHSGLEDTRRKCNRIILKTILSSTDLLYM